MVLILGNGFDLDLGLRTGYSDFVNSDFFPKNLTSALGQFLSANAISNEWFNLEDSLRDFAQGYDSPHDEASKMVRRLTKGILP